MTWTTIRALSRPPAPKKGKGKQDADAASEGGPKNPERREKHCTLCAKWSPHTKNTHNTKECRKWNRDGTPLRKAASSNSHSNYVIKQVGRGFVEALLEMRKEQKSLRKLLTKRSKRSRKRARRDRYASSSDSSSGEE